MKQIIAFLTLIALVTLNVNTAEAQHKSETKTFTAWAGSCDQAMVEVRELYTSYVYSEGADPSNSKPLSTSCDPNQEKSWFNRYFGFVKAELRAYIHYIEPKR